MIGVALTMMLAGMQQQAQPLPQVDTRPTPWREQPGTPDEQFGPMSQERIERTYESAACVVRGSRAKVAATLDKDYRSAEYKRSFLTIMQNNASCFGRRGSVRPPSLTLTGAMAETLLKDSATPLNVRLARAAAAAAAAPDARSDTEAGALCVVRSVPDQVAALIATVPGSAEAIAASTPVTEVFRRCYTAADANEYGGPRLRALVALATLRSVNSSGTAATGN